MLNGEGKMGTASESDAYLIRSLQFSEAGLIYVSHLKSVHASHGQ